MTSVMLAAYPDVFAHNLSVWPSNAAEIIKQWQVWVNGVGWNGIGTFKRRELSSDGLQMAALKVALAVRSVTDLLRLRPDHYKALH